MIRSLHTRIPAFDGLRGIAVILVVLFHVWLELLQWHPNIPLVHAFKLGWIGVDIFFVLSGFLITAILLEEKTKPAYFRNFFVKRALRIFPAYFALVLAVTLAVISVSGHGTSEFLFLREHLIWLWLFLQNIAVVITQHPYGYGLNHLWSLAIEAQFYLVWPFAVLFLSINRLRLLTVALIILSPALRHFIYESGGTFYTIYFSTLCRLDPLAMGALVAIILHSGATDERYAKACIVAGVIAGLAGLLYFTSSDKPFVSLDGASRIVVFSISCVGLISASIITMVTMGIWRKGWSGILELTALRYIGQMSFGLYVYHFPILYIVTRAKSRFGLDALYGNAFGVTLVSIAYVGICLVVAALSWHLFERRILGWKDRLTSAGRSPLRSST